MIVQHAPHLGYQLYFADPRSDTEILKAWYVIGLYSIIYAETIFLQLKKFLTLVFAADAFNNTMARCWCI
jgi:hypothetical protein